MSQRCDNAPLSECDEQDGERKPGSALPTVRVPLETPSHPLQHANRLRVSYLCPPLPPVALSKIESGDGRPKCLL